MMMSQEIVCAVLWKEEGCQSPVIPKDKTQHKDVYHRWEKRVNSFYTHEIKTK